MTLLRFFLMTLGAVFLLAIVAATMYAYSNVWSERSNWAKKKDVAFILNWGGLNPDQTYEVVSSHRSRRSVGGNHRDRFCIQIADFTPNTRSVSDWIFGSELDPVVSEARRLAFETGDPESCFGAPLGAESQDLAAYIWSIELHGRAPAGSKIIFFHRPTNRLLYVSHSS